MTQLLHDYNPALRFGAKILPSEILGMGLTIFGNVYYVDYGAGVDTNDGLTPTSAFKTIAKAYSTVVTGNDDVIVLDAGTAHVITSMITVAKSKVHFVGDLYGHRFGPRAKISMGVTTATTDIAMFINTGSGNTFEGIKFAQDNTLAQALAVVGEGGEYAIYRNCEFYRSTLLNGATSCELACNADSALFLDCVFGSLSDDVVGDVIHPCVRLAASVVTGGAGSTKDTVFHGCYFLRKAGGTTTSMVHSVADADLQRMLEFRDCRFINTKNATALPAVAISLVASLTASQILLTGDTVAVNCTKVGTGIGIISCTSARVATATIGIQGT